MLDTIDILTLLAIPKIGRKRVIEIANQADIKPSSLGDLYSMLEAFGSKAQHLSLPSIDELADFRSEAERSLEQNQDKGVEAIGLWSENYPSSLRQIKDPPVVLYVRGDAQALGSKLIVAIVGTREPSDFGGRSAHRLAGRFVSEGFTVVSGLAKGVDAAAHLGCLDAGGLTIAIMAHGLDTVYPAENRKLAERIVESGGCLISEYPSGTRPMRQFFVDRDRLQSGLSLGVVVIETDEKGGTMHTVGFCLEQGRKLACLVHPSGYEGHAKSRGNRKLLREGKAQPISDGEDLLAFSNSLKKAAGEATPMPAHSATSDNPIEVANSTTSTEPKRRNRTGQMGWKAGDVAPASGKYIEIGPRGGKGREITLSKGDPFPPVQKRGRTYLSVDGEKQANVETSKQLEMFE